jgi:hypothetical protein
MRSCTLLHRTRPKKWKRTFSDLRDPSPGFFEIDMQADIRARPPHVSAASGSGLESQQHGYRGGVIFDIGVHAAVRFAVPCR